MNVTDHPIAELNHKNQDSPAGLGAGFGSAKQTSF